MMEAKLPIVLSIPGCRPHLSRSSAKPMRSGVISDAIVLAMALNLAITSGLELFIRIRDNERYTHNSILCHRNCFDRTLLLGRAIPAVCPLILGFHRAGKVRLLLQCHGSIESALVRQCTFHRRQGPRVERVGNLV